MLSDLRLRNTSRVILLGPDTEANPPTDLQIAGRVDPIADAMKIDLHVTPFARQKTLSVDFLLSDIHGNGIIDLDPQLASRLDTAGLQSGRLSATLNATLQLQTVRPTDFDLNYGGKLDFDVKDISFRADPTGPVLMGVGEIRSDGIVVKPNSGGVEIRELDIDNIVGRATRDGRGIHALGLTIKEHPVAQPQPVLAPPQLAPALAPAPIVAVNNSQPPTEIKIDRLLVSGMDFRFEDQTATPRFVFPIDGLDLEAQGLSSLALVQEIPIRFDLLVSAAKVPLPSAQGGFKQLEDRDLFSQITASGAITLYPHLKGWAKASLNGFELSSLYGIAQQHDVKLGAGTFDGNLDVRLPGDGSVDSSTKLVLTDLSLSEPPHGIITRTLKLPAPLDLVIASLQDQDGSITVPLNVPFEKGNLRTGAIAASAVGAFGQIIATAIASSPLKIANLFGGGKKESHEPPVIVSFPAGYAELGSQQMSTLTSLAKQLKADQSLDVILRGDLGRADVVVAGERSNPTPDDALALANSLNRRRDELLAARFERLARPAGISRFRRHRARAGGDRKTPHHQS